MEILNRFPKITGARHLPKISVYNCNYYAVTGHRISPENCIVKAVCHEEDNYYTFEMGHMRMNGEFEGVAFYEGDYDETINDFIVKD